MTLDLGTTLAQAAIADADKTGDINYKIILNEVGMPKTPNVSCISKRGDFQIGSHALSTGLRMTNQCFYDTKRMIGRKIDDPLIQRLEKFWPFKIIADENNQPVFEANPNN